MKRITMMDNLTLYINKNEYKIEIDEKYTKVSNLDQLEDLEQSITGFFDLESLSKQNNKIYLVYNLPEGYESLERAKKYVPVIKLQLIKNILDLDPLLESEGMTYLDLNNIFFKNYKDIKLLYRSNGYLPFQRKLTTIEHYKLFVLGFYSDKFSYKRYLVNKDGLLRKENNEFMFAVNAVTSIGDLRTLVDKELEKEQSNFYERIQFQENSRKKSSKRRIYTVGACILIFGMLFAGGVKQAEKKALARYEVELVNSKEENELTLAVSSGDTEKAEKIMKKRGQSVEDIAKMLMKAGKYDEAISYDETIEKQVVARLYELGQREKILDLKSKSSFLSYEKEIVEYDEENLIAKIPLIEDKDSLKRLALAFIEHENFENAKNTLTKLKDNTMEKYELSKAEVKEIDQYIKKSNLEMKVIELNEQISTLKAIDPLTDENEDITKKREKEIKTLEDNLIEVQKDLIITDEKIGIDE